MNNPQTLSKSEAQALLDKYEPLSYYTKYQRDSIRVPLTISGVTYWIPQGTLARMVAQADNLTVWDVKAEPLGATYAVSLCWLTWYTTLSALQVAEDIENDVRAVLKSTANIAIPALLASQITKYATRGLMRQWLGHIGDTVYYTDGHFLLRQGPANPKIAGVAPLDFGNKPVKKGSPVLAVYERDRDMPDCERVIPKGWESWPGVKIDVAEVKRLHDWWKRIPNHERFNALKPGGLYENFEQGNAQYNIHLQAGYNIAYLWVAADWCGAGSVWHEREGNVMDPLIVESADGQRIAVVMPLRT